MPSIYKHLDKPSSNEVYPGYKNVGWIAPLSAFLALQEPNPVAGAAPADHFRITTAHTFPEGEGFIKVYCAPDTVEGPGTAVGPKGSMRIKWQPKFFIAADSPERLAFISQLLNDEVILVYQDMKCPDPRFIQFGCDCNPCVVSASTFASSHSGDDSGRKGYEVTLDSYCKFFYEGSITEKAI